MELVSTRIAHVCLGFRRACRLVRAGACGRDTLPHAHPEIVNDDLVNDDADHERAWLSWLHGSQVTNPPAHSQRKGGALQVELTASPACFKAIPIARPVPRPHPQRHGSGPIITQHRLATICTVNPQWAWGLDLSYKMWVVAQFYEVPVAALFYEILVATLVGIEAPSACHNARDKVTAPTLSSLPGCNSNDQMPLLSIGDTGAQLGA